METSDLLSVIAIVLSVGLFTWEGRRRRADIERKTAQRRDDIAREADPLKDPGGFARRVKDRIREVSKRD